ncbi:MAG: citramalate synthase [Syntrophomonadaceae bacterium]|nr:citramalate synthase [Syntrophomonadaceae bacterium]
MKIFVYDTTLRDGTQGEGISLTVEDKLKIAAKLDYLGVDYIEGGWPGSNPKDLEFFRRARHLPLCHAKLAAFGSTRRPGARVDLDPNILALIHSGTSVVTLVGKSWDLHVTQALSTTLAENLAMIRESVFYLKDHGLEVIYDAEHFFDGFRCNPIYALDTLIAAREAGADWLVLCDTNGGSMPFQIEQTVKEVISQIPAVSLGIHTHNDSDLAVANSLAAVLAGARQVQGTVNGWGERCGNASLCSVISNLEAKLGYQVLPPGHLQRLTEVARYASEIANVVQPGNLPFVGISAFAHKGGIHASAVMKNSQTYEHMSPETVGNQRRVLVSELAGAASLRFKAEEMGLMLDEKAIRGLVEEIKQLEHLGYQFEGAEASLELLMQRVLGRYWPTFKLESFKVLVEKRAGENLISEAVMKIRVNEAIVHTAAEGKGPVNALDNALRKALEEFYPGIKEMHLTDYKVRVLEEKDGTEAKVRVLIESRDRQSSWSTVGVSENIIEASWQALVDSMNYLLLKRTALSALAPPIARVADQA